MFREAIKAAVAYKENATDFLDQVMRELEVIITLCKKNCVHADFGVTYEQALYRRSGNFRRLIFFCGRHKFNSRN